MSGTGFTDMRVTFGWPCKCALPPHRKRWVVLWVGPGPGRVICAVRALPPLFLPSAALPRKRYDPYSAVGSISKHYTRKEGREREMESVLGERGTGFWWSWRTVNLFSVRLFDVSKGGKRVEQERFGREV